MLPPVIFKRPSLTERCTLLTDHVHLLPLFTPRSFYGNPSAPKAVPRVFGIGRGNPDNADDFARRLECDAGPLCAQFEEEAEFVEVPGASVVGEERSLSIDALMAAHQPGAPLILWWHLALPLVASHGTRALLIAQLGWREGAEDFACLLSRRTLEDPWEAGPLVEHA